MDFTAIRNGDWNYITGDKSETISYDIEIDTSQFDNSCTNSN